MPVGRLYVTLGTHRRVVVTLEEQFACLVADVAYQHARPAFAPFESSKEGQLPRTRTVYSVGEAMNQKGQSRDAKLGAGFNRDTAARR